MIGITDRSAYTSPRKLEHLRICAREDIEAGESGFKDVKLVHNSLPECSMGHIDTKVRFLDFMLGSPLFISAMTGGHPETTAINYRLGEAAERYNIGVGVGSQRAALENPELEDSFSAVRESAPNAFICGNLGAVQLRDRGLEWADRAVEMIDAQALCIHLNPLQEAIQPEGDHDTSGCISAIAELCRSSKYPVIVKETGAGISAEAAEKLWSAGVSAIDTGGLGGTSWAAVEMFRAEDGRLKNLGHMLSDWGIPTVVSLIEVCGEGRPVIASGGLRSGIDIAKALTLGAALGGMALPLLKPAMESSEALFEKIEQIHDELLISMYLTGSKNCTELAGARTYITGKTGEMI